MQLPKGRDQILAVLGVLAAGATYVPIGFDQPVGRRAEILRTGDIVAAMTVPGADLGVPIPTPTSSSPPVRPVCPRASTCRTAAR
ncbi:phenyloxazoline synthase MbtB [Mycobacteroides abscessus subsp. abscessus]|nr:phenyloxazoline synthase MbtB [Mycobacteroides abscessus subsp. abscessus]